MNANDHEATAAAIESSFGGRWSVWRSDSGRWWASRRDPLTTAQLNAGCVPFLRADNPSELASRIATQESLYPQDGPPQAPRCPPRNAFPYQATEPPGGATCQTSGCCSAANVRLIIPATRFEADGIDHTNDTPTFDTCELHWTGIRDACMHNGHDVVDTTGDIRQLAADFPQVTIFRSDGGRLYASGRINGSPQGTTLDDCLVGQLRDQLERLALSTAVDAIR